MTPSISILVLFLLSISAFTLEVKSTVSTKNINTWQDAIQVLFVNPRGKSIEASEALRLLRLAEGRKVGPFEVDLLLEFYNDSNEAKCTGKRFYDFDRAFKLSQEKAPILDGYLRECLKKQVAACKFEFNFKRALAKLDSQAMIDIERLADLIKLDTPKLQPNEKNVGRHYDLQLIAVALRDLVNRYKEDKAGKSQSSEQHNSREILLEIMGRLEKQSSAFNRLAHNFLGTLRDPSTLGDRVIARYYKILLISNAVKNESELLVDKVHTLLLEQESNGGDDDKSAMGMLKGFLG